MGQGLSGRPADRRRPTISDVARLAGVHPATASRALNPALPGRISPATTDKVTRAAEKLGYRPDPTARSLRTSRSGFVGVVVPDLTNPVLPPIVRGIESVLWQANLACLLADTHNLPEREAELVDELLDRRCEGLIVATASRQSSTVSSLAFGDVPTVLVTRQPDERSLPLVAGDDAAGVEAAVGHLADLGHRHIAHLTGPPDLSTTGIRQDAFVATMAARLPDRDPTILHGPSFTIEAGRKMAAELLGARTDVTAIVAGNDMIALGCYQALSEAGLECPTDISVVGHNDMPLVDQINPALTTVTIPQFEVGTEAAQILLAVRRQDEPVPQTTLLPTRLTVRASTGPPAT